MKAQFKSIWLARVFDQLEIYRGQGKAYAADIIRRPILCNRRPGCFGGAVGRGQGYAFTDGPLRDRLKSVVNITPELGPATIRILEIGEEMTGERIVTLQRGDQHSEAG